MINLPNFPSAAAATALLLVAASLATPVPAAEAGPEQYLGEAAVAFASPDAAVEAFKNTLAADDLDGLAKLLGLDPATVRDAEGVAERFEAMRAAAARQVILERDEDQYVITLGRVVWPFPFQLRKVDGGTWSFDTLAGIEEVVNRRIGENELAAIATARAYVDAQLDYAGTDRDADGVFEYAQNLVSSEGTTDGLYWPIEQGDGESPAGAYIAQAELTEAQQADRGYFGYRFRILPGQGENIAGGRYDYVINGNMIAGFALIAWPVEYAETGVYTFMVNHAGVVYEKDLGDDTSSLAAAIDRFDPDDTWAVVHD